MFVSEEIALPFVHGAIEHVSIENGRFDLIYTSNIFDWMEKPDGAKILEALAGKLSEEGCMLVRMAFAPVQDLVALLPNGRPFDRVLAEQVAETEYSHFWHQNRQGIAMLSKAKKVE